MGGAAHQSRHAELKDLHLPASRQLRRPLVDQEQGVEELEMPDVQRFQDLLERIELG